MDKYEKLDAVKNSLLSITKLLHKADSFANVSNADVVSATVEVLNVPSLRVSVPPDKLDALVELLYREPLAGTLEAANNSLRETIRELREVRYYVKEELAKLQGEEQSEGNDAE